VRNEITDNDIASGTGISVNTEELYQINQDEDAPMLESEDSDLLAAGEHTLTQPQQENLTQLRTELDAILDSQHPCPGDGNDDGVVDQADLDEFENRKSTRLNSSHVKNTYAV